LVAVTLKVVQMAIPSSQTVPVLYLNLIMTLVPTISTEEYICGVPDTRNPTVIAHDLRPAMAAFQSPLLGELMGMVSHPTCISSLLVPQMATPFTNIIISFPFIMI
jgi:hypothetical protein